MHHDDDFADHCESSLHGPLRITPPSLRAFGCPASRALRVTALVLHRLVLTQVFNSATRVLNVQPLWRTDVWTA